MANGDNSNFATLTTGEGYTFDVEGANASLITAFAAGKAASVALVRETFDGTSLTTAARTLDCIFGGAADVSTTVVSDTFTEASDTALGSHTPDTDTPANGWVANDGGWEVKGSTDRLETTASAPSGTYYIATIDADTADATITCRVNPNSASDNCGVILRYADANNYLRLRINHAYTPAGITLLSMVGGSENIEDFAELALNATDSVDLNITMSGGSINIIATRVGTGTTASVSYTDGDLTANTKHGFYSSASGVWFDTLTIAESSGARITLYPDEPIFNDDTSVEVTADAGLVTDGTVSSAAISSQSVTNTSAKDYEAAYIMPMSEPRIRHTESFTVDCFAAGFVSFDDPGEFGIDTVTVEVTDSGATSTGEIEAAFTPASALGTYGRESRYPRWRATINPATDFDSGAASKGIATVTIRAYPKDGDTAVSRSYFVYLDPSDTYDTKVAYVDTRMELPLASAVAGSFRPWAKITGGTSGATAVVIGAKDASTLYITSLSDEGYSTNKWPQFNASETITSDVRNMGITGLSVDIPGGARVTDASSNAAYVQGDHASGATTLYYLPVSGTLDTSGTLTFEFPDYDAKAMTTATATSAGATASALTATTDGQEAPSNSRDWDGGTLGDPDDPFFYPGTAMEAIEAASSDSKASFSELRYVTCGVIPGNYKDYAGADVTPDTTDGAITITAAEGHTPRLVKNSYYSSYGWHTAHTRMVGIAAWRDVNTPLQNEGPHTTTDGPTFGAVDCDLYCTSDRNGQILWTYLRNCLVGNTRASGLQANTVIDCGIYALGNDVFSSNGSSNFIAINNAGEVAEVSPNHQSVLQLGGNFSNCGLILNRIVGSATAGWYTRQDDTDYTFSAMLSLWNEYADDNDNTRRESAIEGLMEYCNTTKSTGVFPQYADTGTDWSHVAHYHIGNLRTSADWGPAAFQSNGYFARYENDPGESAGWSGATNTATAFAEAVADSGGNDFTPTTSCPTMPKIATYGPDGSLNGATVYIGAAAEAGGITPSGSASISSSISISI